MFFRRSSSLTANDAAAALSRGDLQLVDVREAAELTEARVKGGMIAWSRAGLPLAPASKRGGA